MLRLVSSSRPRGWSQEGTPSSLLSREAEQEEARNVTGMHTQVRWGTPIKEEDADTQDFPRDLLAT